MLDWLRQLIGLPAGFAGVIQDSASSATLCALLVARERATGWQANEVGLARLPAARVLRLGRGPFLGREGGQDRRPRPATACA